MNDSDRDELPALLWHLSRQSLGATHIFEVNHSKPGHEDGSGGEGRGAPGKEPVLLFQEAHLER